MGELRQWWSETNRGFDVLGKALLLSTSVSVPGFVRYLADKTQGVPIYQALTTTLPLTAAAIIIAYRGYRKLSLSPGFIAATIIGTAAATAALGIAGGGGVREAFIRVRTAPDECLEVQSFSVLSKACLPGATTYDTPHSLPEVLFRLGTVYWNLWGFWGMFAAIAVGWFLGWFLARQVVGFIAGPRAPQPEVTGRVDESKCLGCGAALAPANRFCPDCGQARPTT